MHQQALRTVLLIQAIEETDRTGEVIPLADRAEASRAVIREAPELRRAEPGTALSPRSETFLIRRAERLLERLRARSPAVTNILELAGGLTWLGRVVLVAALVMGVSLSALDGSRRINILAFPLLGLIAWNLAVYLLLLGAWLRGRREQPASGPQSTGALQSATLYERWISGRIEGLLRRSTRFNVPLTNGLRRFAADWSAISQPLLVLRAKRLLHLAAALVAIGLIAGLYVRGLALRYEAGWESTFLGSASAFVLISVLYGPASILSGISLGSQDQLASLRWTANGGGGEAASWIHLIALTGLLYIVLPRLLAALAAAFGIWRFSRRAPFPPRLLGYARALIIGVGTGKNSGVASVTPYAYEPKPPSAAGLEVLLGAALGGNLKVEMRPPVKYGDEKKLGSLNAQTPATWNVLLMTLASTPEVENHGAFIGGWRDWLLENADASPLLILIDEGPYASRMRGDPGFEQRVQERRKLWSDFVAGYGLGACFVDLVEMKPGAASEINAREAARAALWTASEQT
jgi:hypothetical protein